MSTQQARIAARNILVNNMASTQKDALDYLSVGGVMTAAQMGITPRSLRRHRKDRVIDRLSYTPATVEEKFREYGLPVPEKTEDLQLYTLGPVGVEIAKMRYDIEPPVGYLAYTLERLMHDIVVNEWMLRIGRLAITHEWHVDWIGEREATLYRDHHQILKPDALICLKKDDQRRFYLLEYHNEDKSTRAAKKVRRYEQAYTSNLWQEAWETDVFPPVLASFRKSIVGYGYQEGIEDRTQVNCTYYGMALSTLLEDPEEFFNFNAGEKELVWPWAEEQRT
jgi:hypothetical protein